MMTAHRGERWSGVLCR